MGIRTFTDKETGELKEFDGAFFKNGWRADSVAELFANLHTHLKKIPKKEHHNLFLTACECGEEKRDFQSSHTVWFDIDGIEKARISEYIETFCAVLNVQENQTGIVSSGRGLHFYVGLKTPIVDKAYFSKTKEHYKAALDKLGEGFKARGLPFKLDPSVWNGRQLMRLPGTANLKPGKEPARCELLQAVIVPTDFDLMKFSGLPVVEATEQVDAKSLHNSAFAADPKAVFQGCEFLKYCKTNAASVTEPEWYAALSIVARFPDGNRHAHELSMDHPGYSADDTDKKIEQAVKASGPRTCKSINGLWGACTKCPHWEKITSPIMLRDPNEIKTEKTGFYHYHMDKNGVMKRGLPDYEGLLKFFARKHSYRCTEKVVFTFTGTHYEEYKDIRLAEFAQKNFKPECRKHMVDEFKAMVQRTEIVDPEEWAGVTSRKVNFQNGVLNIDSLVLEPHSPEQLFRYCLPYNYEPGAVAPQFDKFLSDVTGNDEKLKTTLLEFGGYALIGEDCRYQKALILDGEGNNGKSTFMETIKAAAGKRGYSSLSFSEMNNPDRRTALDGALFNITEETPNKLWETVTFKNLVSGGELQVRYLYKSAYAIRNRAKLIFSCNSLPIVTDNSRGFFRRFLIVPFNQKFSIEAGNVDLRIGEKLRTELPGIFNAFLAGYKKLEAQGAFTKQLAGADAELNEYKSLTDPAQYWLEECATFGDEGESTVAHLYKSYYAFCVSNGYERQALPSNIFGKHLKSIVPEYEKRFAIVKRDGRAVRVLKGIKCEVHGDKEF